MIFYIPTCFGIQAALLPLPFVAKPRQAILERDIEHLIPRRREQSTRHLVCAANPYDIRPSAFYVENLFVLGSRLSLRFT